MSWEDYEAKVKLAFKIYYPSLSEKQIRDYFESDDIQQILREKWSYFLDPKSDLEGSGHPDVVAHLLSLLY